MREIRIDARQARSLCEYCKEDLSELFCSHKAIRGNREYDGDTYELVLLRTGAKLIARTKVYKSGLVRHTYHISGYAQDGSDIRPYVTDRTFKR